MPSLTLFGAGRRGTALSCHLANAGRDVTLWTRRPDVAEELQYNRQHPDLDLEVALPDAVTVTDDLTTAAEAADTWGLSLPPSRFRDLAEQLQDHTRSEVTVVSLRKGFEANTRMTMSAVLNEVLDDLPADQIGALHGPTHSDEVANGFPTTIVAAAPTEAEAEYLQDVFMTDRLRVYVNTDVTGVEVGSSATHVLALATGISDGVGHGDNIRAALITQGVAEFRRLGQVMGAEGDTFSGLTGFGTFVGTCTSRRSRNRKLGQHLGEGTALNVAQAEVDGDPAGLTTTKVVHELAQEHGVEMPITEAVHDLLFDDLGPNDMVEQLMMRPAERERWLPHSSEDESAPPTV